MNSLALHTTLATHLSLKSLWRVCCLLLMLGSTQFAIADALDEQASADPLLSTVAEALAAYGIDVTTNLNAREVVRVRIDQPRLGRFPDIPENLLPSSDEIQNWEVAYQAGEIGGLVILGANAVNATQTLDLSIEQWLDAPSSARLFVSFHADDLEAIKKIQQVTAAYSFESLLLMNPQSIATAGEFYATAAQRLALDSRTARRYDSKITEFEYLGERVRRDVNSLFAAEDNVGDARIARNEPAVFQKETLGDEFNQSTIREIVVPGGVALGESAQFKIRPAQLRYSADSFTLIDDTGKQWALPAMQPATLKALFDFVSRSQIIESDAIVDIDGDGRVRITDALRDTDAGFEIMDADTQPFSYVRNLAVTKSVIIDTAVNWFGAGDTLQFETGFEVRFLSADSMRIAQTRVALEYEYDSQAAAVEYHDAWGREASRLHDNLDYAGLGNSVAMVANYAGWVGLFRTLVETEVPFLHGRYEFMKLDKSGRSTPARY